MSEVICKKCHSLLKQCFGGFWGCETCQAWTANVEVKESDYRVIRIVES